jgi:hypothetical protein
MTIGKFESVDTQLFRMAVQRYSQCLFGIRHDDYDYGQINILLTRYYIRIIQRYSRPHLHGVERGQTPEGYILKDIISYAYPYLPKSPKNKKRYFLSLFGAGYFGDITSLF